MSNEAHTVQGDTLATRLLDESTLGIELSIFPDFEEYLVDHAIEVMPEIVYLSSCHTAYRAIALSEVIACQKRFFSDTLDRSSPLVILRQVLARAYAFQYWYPIVRAMNTTPNSRCRPMKRLMDMTNDDLPPSEKGWFVKFPQCSPKQQTSPIRTWSAARQLLSQSTRTSYTLQTHGQEYPRRLRYVVLREWKPARFEFRCFVLRGKIVAISQYDTDLEEPPLLVAREILRREILARLESSIPYRRCTMDVGVDEKLTDYWIIEFNTFGPEMFAGSCLLDWWRDFREEPIGGPMLRLVGDPS